MELDSKIFVAGHRGLVGSAIVRKLNDLGYKNIITRTRKELDLMDPIAVKGFFADERPEYIFLAAAKVGGILENDTKPADFVYQNLQIQNNIIHNAYISGAKKLLFLGSNCIYPKYSEQPIKEEYLLTGKLEPTNKPYAVAKIAGIEMCQAYRKQYGFSCISLMPGNMYGENDNYDKETSHVFAALIQKFVDAYDYNLPSVELFGDGSPMREFLFSDDLALACILAMNKYDDPMPMNVSSGIEYTIKEVAEMIGSAVGFQGEIIWNTDLPNGTPRKQLDLTRINSIGWEPQTSLSDGINLAIDMYRKSRENQ